MTHSLFLLRVIIPSLLFFVPQLTLSPTLSAQITKTPLTTDDYNKWQRITDEEISSDGSFVVYHEMPNKGDITMKVVETNGRERLSYHRGENSSISNDARFVVFNIKPHLDSIRALQRVKTKEDDLPKDTLGIFDIRSSSLRKIPNVKAFEVPEEWSGYITYTLDVAKDSKEDSASNSDTTKVAKTKKVSDDNGYHLVVYNLDRGMEDTIRFVLSYQLAKDSKAMIYHTSGVDSTILEGVYHYDFIRKESKLLASGKGEYAQLTISEDGTQSAFLLNKEDPKSYTPSYVLKYWKQAFGSNSSDSATTVLSSSNITNNWVLNTHQGMRFSQDGSKLFFHTSPPPIIKDTTLLEDEIVQVEVWSSKDSRLQTQQNVEQKRDEEKGYLAIFRPSNKSYRQLSTREISEVTFGENQDRNHRFAFGGNTRPYLTNISWEGFPPRQDIYLIDQLTGAQTSVAKAVRGSGDISPDGKYLFWYNMIDTAYYIFNIQNRSIHNISDALPTSIVDELDDHPDFPRPYGLAGWTTNDQHVLIYDRFDIWRVDLSQPTSVHRLTQGREDSHHYRIRHLDPDRSFVDFGKDMLHVFNESSRQESFARLGGSGVIETIYTDAARLRGLTKAKKADSYIYTAQSNTRSPNLIATDQAFVSRIQVSDANPQQNGKKWSTVEMINWTSLDGIPLEGLVYKPEDFDASKKYPMIVYFYEKNADNIHRYWGAFPHRSIINPNYYASQGYIVFIPDIVYRDGYPGPSCYNAVMPGITHLLDQGYIDSERIGMQGHSWGGYQTAYLATRTNIFACAESGAPVANMTSAYGGIRWGTGLSRMFQYERTQSRLGGTLWEYPMRYIENSPLFFVDKINTPMLLMHNDHDTAVPWYQGIELFVALRRLEKTAWMLNYNDEPHWPTKRENIFDFNVRMQQFFDHYLMGADMPEWMQDGIPAIEKGYNKGY